MRLLQSSCIVLLLALGACGEVVGAGSGPAAPTITSIAPDHGPFGGGTVVTVTGTGLDAVDPFVVIGGFVATDATIVSDTSLTFVLPAGGIEGGTVDVTVSNQDGFATLANAFRYNELPLVIDVEPPLVAGAGGTEITITGRGFADLEAGDATVTVGGIAATGITVVDDETITATAAATPSIDPFTPLDVVVSNANGAATGESAVKNTGQGLIALERRSSQTHRIQFIRLSDGYTAEIATADTGIHGCATSASGEVMVLSRGGNGHRLGRLDLGTGAVTPIADLRDGAGTAKNVTSMTFVGPTLFGWARNDNRLASINPTTGLVTILSPATLGQSRPNAVGVRDASSVFFVDSDCQTLDSINTTTGVLTVGPSLAQTTCANYKGMVTTGGATFLAEYSGQRRLFTINTTTGIRTEVARLPFAMTGLCTTPPGF